MTQTEHHLIAAYQRTGLALQRISFAQAMAVRPIRISLECAVSASIRKTGTPAPIQSALI